MKQWLVSWNKSEHTLTWVHGDIEHVHNPVNFSGIEQLVCEFPVSPFFPVINFEEWMRLLQLRKDLPQDLPPHLSYLNDGYLEEITMDVFPYEYSLLNKGMQEKRLTAK